jgi:hypothetical protein
MRTRFSGQRPRLGASPQLALVRRGVFLLFASMLSLTALYLTLSFVLGATVLEPRGASGVVRGMRLPDTYLWRSEMAQSFRAGGGEIRHDGIRQAIVDRRRNRFVVDMINVLADEIRIESDGKTTLRLFKRDRDAGRPWQQVNDICAGEPALDSELAGLPDGELFAASKPRMRDARAVLLGEPMWEIELEQPTPQLIRALLLMPLLERATSAAERRWAAEPEELALLDKGRYRTLVARLWVNRNTRQLFQSEIQIQLANGRTWTIFVSRLPNQARASLAGLDHGRPPC